LTDSGLKLSTIGRATLGGHAEMLIMAFVNRIGEQDYRKLALNESYRLWEL
jgi:hypothetical protein